MSYLYDTTVFYKCSQYECEILKVTEDFSELHIEAHRVQKGNEVTCPYCGGVVEIHETLTETIKEFV